MQLFATLSGKSNDLFSVGKIKFKANPLIISEWAELQSFIGANGEYMLDRMAEYLAEKLAARKTGRNNVEIDAEWVKDNVFYCKIDDLCGILTHTKTPDGVPASEFAINVNDCEDWLTLGIETPLDFKALPYTIREYVESREPRNKEQEWAFIAKLLRARVSGLKDPEVITADWVFTNVPTVLWEQLKYYLAFGKVFTEPSETQPDQKKVAR